MKHLARFIIWSFIAIYAIVFLVPKIPAVQERLGQEVQKLLSEELGTKVEIGSIDVRFPNRIIIDRVTILDRENKEMLRAGRLAGTIDLLPLLQEKYSISALQLFGPRINVYHKADSTLNCQFVIDALKSKDPSSTPLDLHITSVIIRNGVLNYDSIGVSKLSSSIALDRLTDDSVNVSIKRTTFVDRSGVIVNELKGNISGNLKESRFHIAGLKLKMPSSEIAVDKLSFGKDHNKKTNIDGSVNIRQLSMVDFLPVLEAYNINVPDVLQTLRLEGVINVERTPESFFTTVNINSKNTDEITVSASAESENNIHNVLISRLHVKENILAAINTITKLPDEILRLGTVDAKGRLVVTDDLMRPSELTLNADAHASRIGAAEVNAVYKDRKLNIAVNTAGLDLSPVTNNTLGKIACKLNVMADVSHKDSIYQLQAVNVKGSIPEFTYKGQSYRNISLDSRYDKGKVRGLFSIKDPKASTNIDIDAIIAHRDIILQMPTRENSSPIIRTGSNSYTDILSQIRELKADVTDTHILMKDGKLLDVDNIHLEKTTPSRDSSVISASTDFAHVKLSGKIDLKTLPYSIANIISHHLPSAPGLPKVTKSNNNYHIDAHIKDLHTIKQFVDIPIEMTRPLDINGYVNDEAEEINIAFDAPLLKYKDIEFTGTHMTIWNPEGEGVNAAAETMLNTPKGRISLSTLLNAANDKLHMDVSWDNLRNNVFRGKLSFISQFYPALGGGKAVETTIPVSHIEIGDTVWSVTSKGLKYEKGRIEVDNFAVSSDFQNIKINGVASSDSNDSLVVNVHNIDVRYMIDLVNFHPRDFEGHASGQVVVHEVLKDMLAKAHIEIPEFKFKKGDFGTLYADAEYSNLTQSIIIDAVCIDEGDRITKIDGNIVPVGEGSIDLDIKAHNTSLGFLNEFCSSFMKDVALQGNGEVRLHGPFSALNLTGVMVADGSFYIKPNGCSYTMPGDTVILGVNKLEFNGIPLHDKDGNTAHVFGGLRHNHLRQITFDMQVRTDRFLAYDFPELYSSSSPNSSSLYCGVAYIDGTVDIKGSDSDVTLSGNVNAQKGSYIIYNNSSPDAIVSKDFISWHSANKSLQQAADSTTAAGAKAVLPDVSGNMRFSFLVNVPNDVKLHLIMDAITGDYIDFYGGGDLRISYYNKGAFTIFGNYNIDHGNYNMTIQNLLKRNFEFTKGSVINFGGAPNLANLNLQAMYHLNSVPLSDLGIGSSFKTNNVPVNCLMNITGTPDKPTIEFSLDLPSLSSDAKQMVNSLISSDETLNQQVLYLLGIGRFYSQSTAGNAGNTSGTSATGTNQTSLAMQSFLSGTLSQQLNQAINSVVKNNNWSLGANVTPGTDGFSNAEYEGLLSGRMLNNRLIFNGQFGYRDNIMKNTQNFIGDFSLQYVLTPKGTISLKVYNQSNDRYFTRSSLNTQGIGVVFQKEFGK